MLCRRSIASVGLITAMLGTISSARAFDESLYPDWSAQWRRIEGGPPRYDMSKPPGLAQQAPLTPEYQALFEASMADQAAGGQGLDRGYRCIPAGMPRQMSGVFPFEFAILPKVTYVLFEMTDQQTRRIYTDGRDWPKNAEPTFTGYSIGKWIDTDGDGRYDELDVETRNLRGPRVWDQAGMPMASDNQAVVKERIFLDKANPDVLHDEFTTTDHSLTRPWTATRNYRRDRRMVWTENNCAEGNNYVVIGERSYFVSGDGYLMPVKKDEAPPDLRYFKQPRN
jgi:hypothetical protein